MKQISEFIARILLAQIFFLAGYNKIGGYESTQEYMNATGVPGELLPLVILLELGGGLALIAGWKTQWISLILALFTVAAAILFHNNFDDQMQLIMFQKNIAIAGGLILLAVYGAGTYSVDRLKR
ncbi:DoxX family protein [Nitrosomonas sp.]|uniref:DoxX family protein n=1 Tax=Nitrosomonas sp. TaxID=42353 RepID=UPI001D59D4D3|nr:DoxX family protein [Nitrosomonas sp.]MCB1948724.1 DoxX family protein [Nitrosomonas sp.]MDR4515528.1 DoxX family protein [Nitrosomonas sp.]